MALIRCPKCDTPLTSEEAGAGTCPSCHARLPASARPDPGPRASAPAQGKPSAGRRLRSGCLGQIGFLALIATIGLGYLAYDEAKLAPWSSPIPQEIKLKELIARGPTGNSHVIVTDFVLCENLVYTYLEKGSGDWNGVWIPIVPTEEADPVQPAKTHPKKVSCLFYSTKIRNLREVETQLNKPKVKGVVTNVIMAVPDGKTRDLLRESYPDTDFDKCLIIHQDRAPATIVNALLYGGGAVVALIVCLACFWPRRPPAFVE